MPYVKRPLHRDLDPNHVQLVGILRQELKPKTLVQDVFKDQSAPVIIEEQMRNSDRLQVYVKWARWSGIREDHRTAAILDAYEQELGRDYAGRIVIALGLTQDEARDLGIQD